MKAIQAAVRGTVAPGATLCTDEQTSYCGMTEYQHYTVDHSAKQPEPVVNIPTGDAVYR